MASSGQLKKIAIKAFDGCNNLVNWNIAKSQEFSHVENSRSIKIGTAEKRTGSIRLGNSIISTGNYGLFYHPNTTSTTHGLFRISAVSGTTDIYYLSNASIWTALSASITTSTGNLFSTTEAEGVAFLIDGDNPNMQIANDGMTVLTSASTSSHFYSSPKARKINFYKGNLYLADFTIGSKRFQNHVFKSSPLLGIVSLVDGDHATASTTIKVTDTKYIRATDSLEAYRGGSLIATLTISAKGEDTITVSSTGAALLSADELWVPGTKAGSSNPTFRWADSVGRGVSVRLYDTFPMAGGTNSRIKMMTNIGDVMVLANDDTIAIWNNSSLTPVELGIGCVSDKGYVRNSGVLFFLSYLGVYQTTGGVPKLISSPVEPYIKGATTAGLQAAAAGKKGFSVFFAIGDVTLYKDDGSTDRTLTDVCLEYEMRQDNWFVHTNVPAQMLETYITSTDPDVLVYSSDTSPRHIYKFLGTEEVDHSGDGDQAEVLWRVDTPEISLADDEKVVNPIKIIAVTDRGNSIQCFVALDGGDFYELRGQFNKGVSSVVVTGRDPDKNDPPRCNRIKISLRDYGAKLCRIAKLIIVFTDANEEKQED